MKRRMAFTIDPDYGDYLELVFQPVDLASVKFAGMELLSLQ